jgi:gliding motility-associated-like protein
MINRLDGCTQVDSVQVRSFAPSELDCQPKILAPNAFSPNGNGENEEFYVIPNAYIGDFEIFIYTRWGELIYYSDNVNFRWDGKYENKFVPVGTYAYVIKYTSLEEPQRGTLAQYGSVTIVR